MDNSQKYVCLLRTGDGIRSLLTTFCEVLHYTSYKYKFPDNNSLLTNSILFMQDKIQSLYLQVIANKNNQNLRLEYIESQNPLDAFIMTGLLDFITRLKYTKEDGDNVLTVDSIISSIDIESYSFIINRDAVAINIDFTESYEPVLYYNLYEQIDSMNCCEQDYLRNIFQMRTDSTNNHLLEVFIRMMELDIQTFCKIISSRTFYIYNCDDIKNIDYFRIKSNNDVWMMIDKLRKIC